jgi:hypothetical protein
MPMVNVQEACPCFMSKLNVHVSMLMPMLHAHAVCPAACLCCITIIQQWLYSN